MIRDPYNILQVAHHAEPEVIEAAYRRLARKYHPDLSSSVSANERMQDINWAYQILRDPTKRASYDQEVRPQAPPKPKPAPQAQPKPKQQTEVADLPEAHIGWLLVIIAITFGVIVGVIVWLVANGPPGGFLVNWGP